MRDAWKFLLNTVSETITFEYWCKLNEYIARNEALEWESCVLEMLEFRYGLCSTYSEKEQVITTLEDIVSDKGMTATDKALEVFTWGTRGQYFWDEINVRA